VPGLPLQHHPHLLRGLLARPLPMTEGQGPSQHSQGQQTLQLEPLKGLSPLQLARSRPQTRGSHLHRLLRPPRPKGRRPLPLRLVRVHGLLGQGHM
jgi:hypothetical protein